MWMGIAFFCAGYVFMGIAVSGFAIQTGNWILISLSLVAYILNIVLLQYAKKKPW